MGILGHMLMFIGGAPGLEGGGGGGGWGGRVSRIGLQCLPADNLYLLYMLKGHLRSKFISNLFACHFVSCYRNRDKLSGLMGQVSNWIT